MNTTEMLKKILIVLLFACLPCPSFAQEKNHSQIKLLCEQTGLQAGREVWMALEFKVKEGWHIYSSPSGEAGYPPRVDWNLPDGFKAGDFAWPTPRLYQQGPIANYVYEGQVWIPFKLTVPSNFKVGDLATLKGTVHWLECDESTCLPAESTVELTLQGKAKRQGSIYAKKLQSLLSSLPRPIDSSWKIQAFAKDKYYYLSIQNTQGKPPSLEEQLYFFSAKNSIDPATSQKIQAQEDLWLLKLRGHPDKPFPQKYLSGILKRSGSWFEDAKVSGLSIAKLSVSDKVPPSLLFQKNYSALGKWLFLGFIGGLILNLMPCVFPIIGIKILGFMEQAGQQRFKIIQSGLLFTLGVLISFWTLAGILLLLRSKGSDIGWGFQLQNSVFVLVLAYIIFAFALSLSGVFEVGYRLTTLGNRLRNTQGALHSFSSGMLATVLATPCAAPFLAPTLGLALAAEGKDSVGIFTAIALGFAAPYLLLSCFPSALKWLPKPGAWMENFKNIMAFPLYATAAYLMWILAGQVESDAALKIFLSLVGLALGCWLYGKTVAQKSSKRKKFKLAATFLWLGFVLLQLGIGSLKTDKEGLLWETWSPEYVTQLQKEGRIVYVDFTARWCATCQINKRVYKNKALLQAFRKVKVVPLKADWTEKDERITQTLKSFGRAAVPFNVFYAPSGKTVILPELLTGRNVAEALREVLEKKP